MTQFAHFKRFSVKSTHVPTGTTRVEQDAFFRSRADFETCVAYWNRIGRGTWRYEAQPGEGDPLPSHIIDQLYVLYDGPVERAYVDTYRLFQR